jgi:thioredoxin reductase
MVLTADSSIPAELRTSARKELISNYNTAAFQASTMAKLAKIEGNFKVEDTEGSTWQGKKLVLAMGVEDIYPTIEGYAKCWPSGMSAIPVSVSVFKIRVRVIC